LNDERFLPRRTKPETKTQRKLPVLAVPSLQCSSLQYARRALGHHQPLDLSSDLQKQIDSMFVRQLARAEIAVLLLWTKAYCDMIAAATNMTAADGFPTLGISWAGRETGFQSGLAAVGHARRAISNLLRSLRVFPFLFFLLPPPRVMSFLLLCPGSHLHRTGLGQLAAAKFTSRTCCPWSAPL